MSLDNIQLSPQVLAALFNNSVVDLAENQPENDLIKQSLPPHLGNNEKNIAIVVKTENLAFLPEKDLEFLLAVLQACKLGMKDITLVNLANNPSLTYTKMAEAFSYQTMLLFDVTTTELEIPLQVPHYQVQQYGNKAYLQAPALSVLETNKEEKKQLWLSLKKIFGI